VHGGGFTTGTGSAPLYRGGALARSAGVIVVTLNYRLGALGFLGHPALATGGDGQIGNYGLADQVAALRWVCDNVAAFGGDPDNVTVFGESAGAMSISALLAAPAARGLFRRAVVQSGPPYAYSLAESARVAQDLCGLLGIREPTRAVLESVPVADLVAASEVLHQPNPEPGHLPLRFLPVIDGAFLPRPILEAVAGGSASEVGLMIGTNRDEITLFGLGDPARAVDDHHGLRRRIAHATPLADVDSVIEAYEAARQARGEPVTPGDMWTAIGTDRVFRWPSLQLAAAHRHSRAPTYLYLFTWAAFGGSLGSCHGLEIPFVFRTVDHPVISQLVGGGPDAEALSARMSGAVESFARTGDPSHEGIGAWPVWDVDERPTMVFGPGGGGLQHRPRDEELRAWEAVLPLVAP
jgi:para-nitrobenzyl esterase